MPVGLQLLLTCVSVTCAVYFGISTKSRNDRKDIEQEAENRAAANTMMMTKLENIADDIKDIKRDYKETREEVQQLNNRVIAVEKTLESYNERLDEIKEKQ